jgi:hypothetical protein
MFKTHRLVPLLFVVALTAGQALHVSATPPARQTSPPQAPVRPVTETLHGVTLTDPYRWMEDGGQEFTDWMKAQDAHTRRLLERIPGRQKLLAELRALNTDATTVTHVRRSAGVHPRLRTGGTRDGAAGASLLISSTISRSPTVMLRCGLAGWPLRSRSVQPPVATGFCGAAESTT